MFDKVTRMLALCITLVLSAVYCTSRVMACVNCNCYDTVWRANTFTNVCTQYKGGRGSQAFSQVLCPSDQGGFLESVPDQIIETWVADQCFRTCPNANGEIVMCDTGRDLMKRFGSETQRKCRAANQTPQ
jgi:hypothetical protein